jgi:hypothetical protein
MRVPYAVEQNVDDCMRRGTRMSDRVAIARHWIMQVQTLTANDLSLFNLCRSHTGQQKEKGSVMNL